LVRFETPPGLQAQVDFAHFRLPWGRRWALLVVLGYSRLLWLRFFRRQTMETLFEGLEQAFAYFEGVPKELLFDQMRSVIVNDERLRGGALVENAEFVRFANHWKFCARACRAYRAKTVLVIPPRCVFWPREYSLETVPLYLMSCRGL
jgi:transposase